MEFLIKIAEWIIALVKQRNGTLEKELRLVKSRYDELQKDKATLEEVFWKADRALLEKQIAIASLNKRITALDEEYNDAVAKGLINIKFIEDSVKELKEMEVFSKL